MSMVGLKEGEEKKPLLKDLGVNGLIQLHSSAVSIGDCQSTTVFMFGASKIGLTLAHIARCGHVNNPSARAGRGTRDPFHSLI